MTPNKISQSKTMFSSNFVVFHYLSHSLLMVSKDFCKIYVSLGLFQNLDILDLALAKDEKVNIAVTYQQVCKLTKHQ
jgi:hypothetical protein